MDRQKIARGVGLSEELFKHRIMRRRGGALCHRLIPACLSCRDSTSHEYLWHPRKPGFYIPLRKHISPDCKRDILFRRGTQIQAGDSLGAACYKRLIPAAKAKAVNHTRDIPQTFWRDDRLPWLELRSTRAAARPISTTATPSSRWGRLSRGNALPVRWPSTCCNPGI